MIGLTALAALSLSATGVANSQALTPDTTDIPVRSDDQVSGLTVLDLVPMSWIKVRSRGKTRFVIRIESGSDIEPYTSWMLRVEDASDDDLAAEETCPALGVQMGKLRLPERPATATPYAAPGVRIGRFTFRNWRRQFRLDSQSERRWAVRWVRQTLEVVEPCWNLMREDRSHNVADRLRLAISAKATP
jgi:hypothetical protein